MKPALLAAIAVVVLSAACSARNDQSERKAAAPPFAAAAQPTLEGVWKRVETVIDSGPDKGTHIADVQPSVFIFVNGYFSVSYIEGYAPRPLLSDSPSDEERGRIFGNFTGYSGTYSLDGAALTINRIVSKNPNLIGRTDHFLVEWARNDVWLTMPTHDGPQSRVRLTRLADPIAEEKPSQ